MILEPQGLLRNKQDPQPKPKKPQEAREEAELSVWDRIRKPEV